MERWCRQCKKSLCRPQRSRLKKEGLRKPRPHTLCRHEGCTNPPPCLVHCQCKDCFSCGERPVGTAYSPSWFCSLCPACRVKNCRAAVLEEVLTEQAQAMQEGIMLQQGAVPAVRRDCIGVYSLRTMGVRLPSVSTTLIPAPVLCTDVCCGAACAGRGPHRWVVVEATAAPPEAECLMSGGGAGSAIRCAAAALGTQGQRSSSKISKIWVDTRAALSFFLFLLHSAAERPGRTCS